MIYEERAAVSVCGDFSHHMPPNIGSTEDRNRNQGSGIMIIGRATKIVDREIDRVFVLVWPGELPSEGGEIYLSLIYLAACIKETSSRRHHG